MPKGHYKRRKAAEERPPELDAPKTTPAEPEDADGNVSDSEADAMFEREQKRKKDVEKSRYEAVDSQEWTRAEPEISEDLLKSGKVWVAVYRCPEGHKTKATNRQKDSGVWCYPCKEKGKQVKADVMPQFLTPSERPKAHEEEKRKGAKRGAQ